ncbi:ROK family protein [Acidocella sp.]|uniref:ROK family protein n=1 Tax=Acidocella sp. TaxID=50710 RepID=UPI00262687D9|nr:ROK family protein [Acidocella sp.]
MPTTLALDIGGTYLKAALLTPQGEMTHEPVRCPTPAGAPPATVLEAIATLVAPLGGFDRLSIGFPGAIRGGIILTAPNLGSDVWHGTDLAALAAARFGRPARLANDATMHGLGVIRGAGIEVALTLGTGMGFALFRDGVPAPQIELGRHPAGEAPSYDDFVGDATYRQAGMAAWKQNVLTTIGRCAALVNFDHLYLGGGNARHFTAEELPGTVSLALNAAGLQGGIKLWRPEMDIIYR